MYAVNSNLFIYAARMCLAFHQISAHAWGFSKQRGTYKYDPSLCDTMIRSSAQQLDQVECKSQKLIIGI